MLINPNENVNFNLEKLKEIYLGGGCFWGAEAYLKRITGVYKTTCGYSNGKTINPTYEEVCKENTDHVEAVKVSFDQSLLSLNDLLEEFFAIIDPTSINKQGGDIGRQYRTGIYYIDKADEGLIKAFIDKKQADYTNPIVTEVLPLDNFYLAEEYHQDYLDKNPNGYCHVDLSKWKA